MGGNIFGKAFTLTTFGESHGMGIGGIIDGCPAGLEVDLNYIQLQMARRRPGQSAIVTQRKEADEVIIQSGIFEGKTTGTPISLWIKNKDQKSKDYNHIKDIFRPSHADFVYEKKYGHRDYRGGGRSSARETAARVAAGAIARMMLRKEGIETFAYVSQVGDMKLDKTYQQIDPTLIDSNAVRCPDPNMAKEMEAYIKEIKKQGDTIGGVITGVIRGCPVGLGEPVFDKMHADLGKAMLSINACKGFEYGSGFAGVKMRGSSHNDVMKEVDGKIVTETNHSGGVQGGITNGMDIYFNVAFKPVATIMRDQAGIDKDGNEAVVQGKGRHDPCVVPRAVPIVEAMAGLVVADHWLRSKNS